MPHNKLIQYQNLAQPVIVPSETITEDKWFSPWSEPVRKKISNALAIALITSGITLVPVVPSQTGSAAAATNSPVTYEIFDNRTIIYPAFQGPVTVTAETVTVDKWYQSWPEPIRKDRRSTAISASGGVIDPFPIPPTPVEATEDSWHYGWSEPVRQKYDPRLFVALIASGGIPNPFPIPSVSGTGVASDSPVVFEIFSRQSIIYPAYQGPIAFAAEIITEDKWYQPWSEPVRTKPQLTTGAQQAFFAPLKPTVSFGWNEPSSWSDPVRVRPRLITGAQQAIAAPTKVVVPFGWNEPTSWSDPVRIRRRLLDGSQQFLAASLQPIESITEDKWHHGWSEPVRQRINPRHAVALIASGATFYPFPYPFVEVLEPSWHYPWSEPVRLKPGLVVGAQQFQTFDPFPLPNPIVEATEASWHSPWSEPVRFKIDPKAAISLAASSGNSLDPFPLPAVSGPATSSIDTAVSFRILGIRRIIYPAYQAPVPIVIEAVTEDKWHFAWSEPVRQKRDPKASIALIASGGVLDPFPLPNPPVGATEASWHYPWSEPVRQRLGLLASQQQSLISVPRSPEIITLDKWYLAWAEPVRTRPGLLVAEQQFLASTFRSLEVITEDKWHFPWSQPVQFKRDPRYLATLAASGGVIYPFPLPPVVIIPEDRWHQPWSEPIRLKLGPRLREYLQQTTVVPPEIIAGGAITGILDATEQGDIFYATGLLFNQVADANVGIIELVPGSALVGVQFDKPTVSANVGIETSITSAQSGTVISSSFSAIVSVKKA